MFSIWLRVRANLYGIRYVFITCVWNPLRLRKNGYVFIKYHTIIVRVPGRRGRCLPKWYGRDIPLRYAGLPFEDEVYHDGRPIILFYVQYAVIAL